MHIFPKCLHRLCLNFTVFMAVGSMRFAIGLIGKYYLISSRNMYKVISSYPFFRHEPYRKQLNNNHTNGPEYACINMLFHCIITTNVNFKKDHSNYRDSQFKRSIY